MSTPTTIALIFAIISFLLALFSYVRTLGAVKRAKEAAADTLRIDAIINENLTLTPAGAEPEWGVVSQGKLVARGHDLRTVLDEVVGHG